MKRLAKVLAVLALGLFSAGCVNRDEGAEIAKESLRGAYSSLGDMRYLATMGGDYFYLVCVEGGYAVVVRVDYYSGSADKAFIDPNLVRCVSDDE